MQRRFALWNQKGGVAKTTSAANIAVVLALKKKRVLCIDFDPQANLSEFLGVVEDLDDQFTAASLLRNDRPFTPRRDVLLPGLDLVPATLSLAEVEYELSERNKSDALGLALSAVAQSYDYIIIDCPPSLGMLAVNGAVAASNILIPVKLSPASVRGAISLAGTIDRLRLRASPYLKIAGVFGTFMVEAANAPKDILQRLKELFGPTVFSTVIHQAQSTDDASGKGAPVVLTLPKSRAADEYRKLTEEVETCV